MKSQDEDLLTVPVKEINDYASSMSQKPPHSQKEGSQVLKDHWVSLFWSTGTVTGG